MELSNVFPYAKPWEIAEFAKLLDSGAVAMARQDLTAPAPADALFTQERLLSSDGWHRELATAAMRWLSARGQHVTVNTRVMFTERCDFATDDGSLVCLAGNATPADVLSHLRAGRQVLLCPYPADDGAPSGWWVKGAISEDVTQRAIA